MGERESEKGQIESEAAVAKVMKSFHILMIALFPRRREASEINQREFSKTSLAEDLSSPLTNINHVSP
jgi:hypothetical protein